MPAEGIGIPIKVAIWGDSGSGKTALATKWISDKFIEKFVSTVGATFFNKKHTTPDNVLVSYELWDLGGQERFRSMIPMYVAGSSTILYCVDLSKKVDKQHIEDELKYLYITMQKKAPHTTVILVGTKADLYTVPPNASEETAQKILDDIKEPPGMVISGRVVTSAHSGLGLNKTDENKSLEQLIWDAHKLKEVSEKTAGPQKTFWSEQKTQSPKFPDSYKKIWNKYNNGDVDGYNGAVALLMDYCKTSKSKNNPNSPDAAKSPGFFNSDIKATAKRIITGHWFRHHVDAVSDTLTALDSKSKVTKELLNTLVEQLKEKNKTIKLDGSLAKRIEFINDMTQGKTKISIDLKALNLEIEKKQQEEQQQKNNLYSTLNNF